MSTKSLSALIVLSIIFFVSSAYAQNRVVVIPLGGDDLTSCSVGLCSVAGEATLTCGSTAKQVACVVPPKLVFISSGTYSGNFGGLAGADAKCKELADAAGLPDSTYRAWLSDATGSPSTRFTQSQGTYVLTNGSVVASSYADLTSGDRLLVAIDVDQNGADTGEERVWTGTNRFGTPILNMENEPDSNCSDWTSTGALTYGTYGLSRETADLDWSSAGSRECFVPHEIYCFEQ